MGTRETPLAMDAATFKALGHQLVDDLADLLASVPARPVTRDSSPSAIREALGSHRPLPEHGSDPAALLSANGAPAVRSFALQRRIRGSSATSPRRRRQSACSAISWPRP